MIHPAILMAGGFLALCVVGVLLMLAFQRPGAQAAKVRQLVTEGVAAAAPLQAQARPRPGERGRQIYQLWHELGQDELGFDIERQWAKAAAAHHMAPFFASMQAMGQAPPVSPGAPAPKSA